MALLNYNMTTDAPGAPTTGLADMTMAPDSRTPVTRPVGDTRYEMPDQQTTGTIPSGVPDMGGYPGFTPPTGGILYDTSQAASAMGDTTVDFSQLDPYTREVQENELVQHQLQGLLSADSPYMDQARLAGERAAAQRGALSSSIFAGASQAAAIQAALPIAAADAQTYSRVASENAAAINQNTMAKMQSMVNLASTNIGAAAQLQSSKIAANTNMEVSRMKIQADQESRQFMAAHDQIMSAIQHGQTIEMANLDFGLRAALANAGFQHDLNMRELSHEQQQQMAFIAQEYQLEQMGYQGSIQNFLQDQQIRAAFLNNGMGNIFQSLNILNQEGVDGAAFATASNNIWRTFGNFMDIFNSLSGGGEFDFGFGPTGP